MKRLIPLILVITLVTWPLFAESTWEGTTAVSRYGEFPESGNYGASNSFAVNTAVTVKNLDNGMETTVIIVDRLENPGLFILVSRDAGKDLGISSGEISRVRASISHPEGAISTFPDDLPFNPDPDVNPAASVTSYPGILESISPSDTADAADETDTTDTAETDDVAETTDTADTADATAETDTTDTAETDEVVETTETTDTADTADTADAADETDTDETVEVAEVDDSPPKINGVDTPSPPAEEQPPADPADEPTPPSETEDPVAVSALSSADDATDEEPRLIVENPPEPPVDRDEVPFVLDLMPAPVLDQTEKFVLLAEPDAPDVDELVETMEPELEEALRISSLEEPSIIEDEILEAIVPPEPVFEEAVVVEEKPVAEDILIVSELIEPTALTAAGYELPLIADEPAIESPGELEDTGDTLVVSTLETAIAEEDEAIAVLADTPEVYDGEGTDEPDLRYSRLDEPEVPVLEGVAELGLEEPIFVADEEGPVEAEDILIVSDLLSPPDPGETGDAIAMTDPAGIDIVLEPAEPRPPEGRIAGADLLETAVGEEPGTDVEITSVSEPGVAASVETTEVAEAVEEPDEARVVDTVSASAGEIPPATIASEDVAKPEVAETTAAEVTPELEEPPVEVTTAPFEYTTLLSRESFYLQLAAFSEAKAAARLKDDLSRIYPVTVYLTESTERPVYKVLVGPLNQDESGALLYQFKVRGFPDAFVREGAVN